VSIASEPVDVPAVTDESTNEVSADPEQPTVDPVIDTIEEQAAIITSDPVEDPVETDVVTQEVSADPEQPTVESIDTFEELVVSIASDPVLAEGSTQAVPIDEY
jgi:formylmethanofuran dehydrogenase subunit E-like metal-binding protein